MANVSIIRHNPIAIFSGTTETVITYDDNSVVRHVEPSGNVGTQFAGELGSEWFGTIQNLNPGLLKGGVTWGDVYKTDVLWTTPSSDRDACDVYKNKFNAVYGPMIEAVTGHRLSSNRMARFTHPEGFPDPAAKFEVQIKAVKGEGVAIGNGTIDYGDWQDHQPSGASILHKNGQGEMVSTLGGDVKEEMEFVLIEQYEKPLAEKDIDFKTQTIWLEVLVAIDDIHKLITTESSLAWERIEAVRDVVADYFGHHRPAGMIYPVSRIPNLDGVVEPQPRIIAGNDIEIERPGDVIDGFSTWVAFDRAGIRETMVSGVGGTIANDILDTVDAHVKASGGQGLKENGIFNNAYIVAKGTSQDTRDWLADFNASFSAYYEGWAPAGRTAQFVGGFMSPSHTCGIANRSIFTV